ncbi:MAG: hypothetical protein EHM38_10580 [Geobacteraceae bacterium]|nr:MAG: hypothetical protein EHM38_10580 [Geobacteraceae bacterium]
MPKPSKREKKNKAKSMGIAGVHDSPQISTSSIDCRVVVSKKAKRVTDHSRSPSFLYGTHAQQVFHPICAFSVWPSAKMLSA